MKRVFTAQTPAEAHLVAGRLEEEGIRTVVEGEMLTGARVELGMDFSTLPTVAVRDEDVQRALAVLRERGTQQPPPTPSSEDQPEPRGLSWFKGFLRIWLILAGVSFCILLFTAPGALPIFLGFAALVGVLWYVARRT